MICQHCKGHSIKKRENQIYCSKSCRDKAYIQRVYKDEIRHEHLKSLHRKYITQKNSRFTRYKSQAKIRNLSFNLTFEQFIEFWNKPCFYCGTHIEGIGLDRLDNNIGYELNNCVPCCLMCNIMKNNQSQKDFINKCKIISDKHYQLVYQGH